MTAVLALVAIVTSASVLTVKVPIPATTARGAAPLVLHVEDLKLPPGSSGHVRVYADLPPDRAAQVATTATTADPAPDDQHYLGSFTVVPKNSAEAAKGIERKSVTVDVTEKASRLAARSEVALTFVALRAPTASSADDAPAQPRIGRVYFAVN